MFKSCNIYSPRLQLVQYNDNYYRLVFLRSVRQKGWEKINVTEENQSFRENKKGERLSSSLSRTRGKIRELALSNNFTYFGTLTISEDKLSRFLSSSSSRYSLNDCLLALRKILKYLKRSNPSFSYLIVFETHKDGAFHFHGLFKNIDLKTNSFGYLYSPLFMVRLGYNSFSLIRDYNRTCSYITKYITKELSSTYSDISLYIASRDLISASRYIIYNDININAINWSYKNDYCYIKELDLTNIKDCDKKLLVSLLNCKYT